MIGHQKEPHMSNAIRDFEPKAVWKAFEELSAIPRCSKCEADVMAFVRAKAQSAGLELRSDAVGNIVVILPATPGKEGIPGIVVQGHVDMVCEKNSGTVHDFSTDPISLVVDGDWLKADGTTLGADNGVAVAMMLALMETPEIAHGPLELLFTVDEETALTGAMQLDPSIITHKLLLNLDSEEEGYFYIGCAGGNDTEGKLPLTWEDAPSGMKAVELAITGLNGGHSGTEIHRELGNPLVLAGRLLQDILELGARLFYADGGDKHNAIPREAFLKFLVKETSLDALKTLVRQRNADFINEFSGLEPGLTLEIRDCGTEEGQKVLTQTSANQLADVMNAMPHGVLGMSRAVSGLVSTSTNFAAMHFAGDHAHFLTSQRSDVASLLKAAAERVASIFRLAGGSADFARGYPGWEPNASSPLLKTAVSQYESLTGKQPIITTIHAGLECGVIGDRCGGMDMLSFGPDIRGAHTPKETVSISSTKRVFDFFCRLLISFG